MNSVIRITKSTQAPEARSLPEPQQASESLTPFAERKPSAEVVRGLMVFSELYPSNKITEGTITIYANALSLVPADLLAEAFRSLAVTSKFFPQLSEILRRAAEIKVGLPSMNKIMAGVHQGIRTGNWPGVDPTASRALRAVGGTQSAENLSSSDIPTWRAQFTKALEREREERIQKEINVLAGVVNG